MDKTLEFLAFLSVVGLKDKTVIVHDAVYSVTLDKINIQLKPN